MTSKLLMSAAGLLTLAAMSGPAYAQAAGDEIIVTAQKREQALQDVPLPVQALGAQQLDDAGIAIVSDLVDLIPGASIVSNSTPGFETIQIRGISSGTTGDGLVGYYIDETPFGVPNLQLTPPARLLDVERVEVLRGPSGTLYGQGSMGGTIKVITRRPDSRAFSANLQGDWASVEGGEDSNAFDAAVNIPLVQDRLALRLSAGIENLGGYAEAPELNLRDANGFESVNYRAALRWTPNNDLAVTGLYWRIQNEQDFNNGLTTGPTLATGNPTIAGLGGFRGYTDVEMDLYSLTLEWDTPIGALTANSSYIDHTLDFVAPLLTVLKNDSLFNTTSFTQEIRLASTADGPLSWIAGVFYRDAEIANDIYFDSDLAAFGLPGVRVPVIDILGPLTTESWSVFGELSYRFTDKLEATVGARYFEDERASSTANRIPPIVRNATSASYDALSPRLNISYRPTDDAMIYFNAARGFRSGVLQTQAQAAASNALGVPTSTQIQPDEVTTYELGAKLEIADGALLVDAGVYHSEWQDIQQQFATSAIISVANSGDAVIEGFDVAVLWRTPVDGLDLQFVGNWNNAEFDRVVPALAASLPTIRVGQPLPNVPDSNYTVSASYARPMEWLGGLTGTFYSAYAWRADQIDAASGLRSGEIGDLTVRLGVEGDRWRLHAFALNALNDDDPAVLTSTGLQILYPRRIGVQLGLNF
ncbi:MAG: TonB-dependent receptor [Alphaproteobacteria bacterium]|nr:TonB-dependent receptor [Alphaproteobacteria bacterium]